MWQEIRTAVLALLVLSGITGLAYPLVVTAIAQVIFPAAADGSLIRRGEQIVGSRLIGQAFDDPRWFWGRPSATVPACNGAASSGSNLGPLNPALEEAVRARVEALVKAHAVTGESLSDVPVDLVTTSGSGLDPHISPAAARWQVERVATARGLDQARVLALVEAHIEGRTFGVLGERRVNVLLLNLALDELERGP